MSDDRSREIRRRVDALSDAQRRVLADAIARDATQAASDRLVAYVVPANASLASDASLRAFLADRLPDYMIPARFVVVEQLPRTAAGKLDRHALVHERGTELPPTTRQAVAPRTALEASLVAIWKDVLRLDDVGVNDDFFEIGGDSLLSIRVIARAGREGIRISPERFFEQPTIAHMAASVVGPATAALPNARREPIAVAIGDAPLTPIQHWFLDAIPHDRDWWNQSYILDVGHPLSSDQVNAVIAALVRHHDALRLRLVPHAGSWRQQFAEEDVEAPFRVVSLRDVPPDAYAGRIIEECEHEHQSVRAEDGGLFRAVFFDGTGGWRRLLLLGHHLVIDGVSWSVILEDVATLVTQTAAGQPLRFPEKTAPARAWAIALSELASTPAIATSADYWRSMALDPPLGFVVEAGTCRDAETLTITLGDETSRLLAHDAPQRHEAPVQALLLAALLLSWHRWTGHDALRFDLEGHGRDVLGDALDVSRTVGWFTTVFPVRLALDGAEPTTGSAVKFAKAALDALPLRGAAHGLARFLAPNDSIRTALAAQPRPAVLFNHLGTHDVTLPSASRLRVTDEPHGRARNPDAPRAYALEINSRFEAGRLVMTVEYSRRAHDAATIERFAADLRSALEQIAHAAVAAGAPVGLAALDASTLATVADLLAEVDDA